MIQEKHLVQFTIGDWGGDGHDSTRTYTFHSSHPTEVIMEAYKAVSEIVGFSFIDTVAEEYEDSILPDDLRQKLEGVIGDIELEGDDWREEGDRGASLMDDEYVDIFVRIVQSDAVHDVHLRETTMDNLNIGGYGLF